MIMARPKEQGRPQSHKLQASVEGFTFYAVTRLIGIKGRSSADVTGFIIKDWIRDHQEELAGYGIDVATWRKESNR